eukprot:768680-Hanusia_phi.AAC.4
MEECLSAAFFVLLEKALELEIREILVLPRELQVIRTLLQTISLASVHTGAQSARSILVVAEAVNAMFDIYAEDDLNEAVLRPLRIVDCLQEMQAMFVAAMKQWLADNKARIRKNQQIERGNKQQTDRSYVTFVQVKQNLPRFIKYKKDLECIDVTSFD